MNNYQLNGEIGKGNHCIVYKGRKRKTVYYYAISSIEKCKRQRVLNSVQILRAMNHPYTIQFHNWYETNHHLWVIAEFCSGGDLGRILRSEGWLKEMAVTAFCEDLCLGLMMTHARGVINNDIKPSNILMDSTSTLRYFDFGLACTFANAAERPVVGTPLYMAPELFLVGQGASTTSSDLWSIGCLLYEMACGSPPFVSESLEELLNRILFEKPAPLQNVSRKLSAFIESLLHKNPLQRAHWASIAQSAMFEDGLPASITIPPEPALELFRKRYRGKVWSDWEKRQAVAICTASAKLNYAQTAQSEDVELTPFMEMDFTRHESVAAPVAAEPRASYAVTSEEKTKRDMQPDVQSRYDAGGTGGTGGNQAGEFESGGAQHSKRGQPTSAAAGTEDRFDLPQFSLEDLPFPEIAWHPSDAHIRPLCNNNRIERNPEPFFDKATLGFNAVCLADIKSFDPEELTRYITTIYKPLSSSSTTMEEKHNILHYIESIACDSVTANILVNSSVMTLCAKFTSKTKYSVMFRATAASVMGILVRYTTLIHTDLGKAGIIPSLVALCSEEESAPLPVLKKLFACLGELLFYIAAQPEGDRSLWEINADDVGTVYLRALHSGDEVLMNYAAKAIENLASVQDKSLAYHLFGRTAIVEVLLDIYGGPQSQSLGEHLRADAISAALKLGMIREELIPIISESKRIDITGPLLRSAPVPRISQLILTFIIYAQLKALAATKNKYAMMWTDVPHRRPFFVNCKLSFEQAAGFLNKIERAGERMVNMLFEVSEQVSSIVHGKSLLLLSLIGLAGTGTPVAQICSSAYPVQTINRYFRDPNPYTMRCSGVFSTTISSLMTVRFEEIAVRVSPTTSPVFLRAVELLLNTPLRESIPFEAATVKSLGECLEKAATNGLYSAYGEEFRSIAAGLVNSSRNIFDLHESIFQYLVKPYAERLKSTDSAAQFGALCFLSEVVVPLSSEKNIAKKPCVIENCVVLTNCLAVAFPALVKASNPCPAITLRLLAALAEWVPQSTVPLITMNFLTTIISVMAGSAGVDVNYCCNIVRGCLHACILRGDEDALCVCLTNAKLPAVLLSVLNRDMQPSYADTLTESVCELAASILEHVSQSPTSRTAIQCLAFMDDNSISRVFLPLCTPSRCGGLCAEPASSILLSLARMAPAAQQELLRTQSVNAITTVLSEEEKGELPSRVATNLLNAILHACEHQDHSETARLGSIDPFIASLVTAAGSTRRRDVSELASRLLSMIKS